MPLRKTDTFPSNRYKNVLCAETENILEYLFT